MIGSMKLNKPKLLKKSQNCFVDKRGFLNPISLKTLFEKNELNDFNFQYQLISFTKHENTFRGFHFQKPPSQQIKVLIVHSGKILDIVFPYNDLKKENLETFKLEAGDALIIPDNYAHGFYTESSDVLLQYMMNGDYAPQDYTGLNGYKYISEKIGKNNMIISENDLGLKEFSFE